jgi:hypothetical protein
MKQAECLLFVSVSLEIAILLTNRNVPKNTLDTVPYPMYFTIFVLYFIKFYCHGFRLPFKIESRQYQIHHHKIKARRCCDIWGTVENENFSIQQTVAGVSDKLTRTPFYANPKLFIPAQLSVALFSETCFPSK